jgi:hypothetical protein
MGKLKITPEEFENLVKMYGSLSESDVITTAEIVNKLDFKEHLGEIMLFCFILENSLELEPSDLFNKVYNKTKTFLKENQIVPVTMSSFRISIYNFIIGSDLCSEISKKYVLQKVNKIWSNLFYDTGFNAKFKLKINLENG